MLQFPQLDFGIFNAETFTTKPGDGKLHTVFLASKNKLYHFIAGHNIWQTSCPIWKKQFVIKLGGFNKNYQRFQDTEFHFRALMTDKVFYKAFYKLKADCYYRLSYPTRTGAFWDTVIENNILYFEEVTNVSKQNLDLDLYKSSIQILSFFAFIYALKAQKNSANALFKTVSSSHIKTYIPAKSFFIIKTIFLLNKLNFFKPKFAKAIASKTLAYLASRQIKKLEMAPPVGTLQHA